MRQYEERDMPVYSLVDKIKDGEIRLPEMQRQYVWRSTQVRNLLDSLYRKYPSGTILTWTPSDKVTTRNFAVEQDDSQQTGFQLLLDGQQRLTALSAILRGEDLIVRDKKRPIDILFNLNHPEEMKEVTEVVEDGEGEDGSGADSDESSVNASEDEILKRSERMAFVVGSKKFAKMAHWVSVTEVLKGNSDSSFLEKAGVTTIKDPRYNQFTKRLEKLRDIRNYSYRVQVLGRNMSYEEVTEIFVRVNSLGTKLRSSDLALAQITAKWEGSLKVFENFAKECRKQYFDLTLAIHLKNLVAFAEPRRASYKAIGKLSKEGLESKWEEAKKGMRFALNFLRNNVKIDNLTLLSSPYILIVLAAYGHSKQYDLSPEEDSYLRYWVLLANIKARYSGSSDTRLDEDLAVIADNQGIKGLLQHLKSQFSNLEILSSDLENKSSRSPHFKTMFMAFKQDEAKDWRDKLVIDLKKSGAQHKLEFHHIFPRAVLKKQDLSDQQINDICNLAFISARTNRWIGDKEPADYLPEIRNKIGSNGLGKQCIPDDPLLWKVDEYENFLSKRRELVAKRLNEFLGHDQWRESDSD